MGAAQYTGGGVPASHLLRGGPQHLTQPGESEKTSQKRWQNQGIHFSRPKATTPVPAASQAPWALWGHLALLPNTSLLPLAVGAFGSLCCFLQGLPHPQPFRFRYSSDLGLSSTSAHCPQAVLASPRCQPPIGISRLEVNSAAHQLPYLMSIHSQQPPLSSHCACHFS